MSYIDTFDHEFVGFFGQLPVYHPLVEHKGSESRGEFSCNPRNLILGGGGGEHPALILKRSERAVTAFVIEWRSRPENAPSTLSRSHLDTMVRWSEQWIADVSAPDALEFAGWSAEVYHHFFELCSSRAVRTPFTKRAPFEDWLLACLGEFIVFSMPELVPELDEQMPEAKAVLRPLYTNILLPPPGYPVDAGRRLIDGKHVYNQRWWPNID